MVGKLIKHELFSTVRVAVIPAIIMLLLAVLLRIMIETSNISLIILILVFYVYSMFATVLIGYFFGINSFYRSLFTGTGYLTLSLPVNCDQLIWSKLISAIVVMFASIIVCLLSTFIFFIGLSPEILESINEAFSTLGYIFTEFIVLEPLITFEGILLGIVYIPMSFLVFYAVMCIGQLFTVKNRKGIAILLFVGLVFVCSILNQLAVTPLLEKTTEISIHLTLWLKIVFYTAVDIGCYFLVRYIIKNKVNLIV